jgi:hypothetical protein
MQGRPNHQTTSGGIDPMGVSLDPTIAAANVALQRLSESCQGQKHALQYAPWSGCPRDTTFHRCAGRKRIDRYVRSGKSCSSDTAGAIDVDLDLTAAARVESIVCNIEAECGSDTVTIRSLGATAHVSLAVYDYIAVEAFFAPPEVIRRPHRLRAHPSVINRYLPCGPSVDRFSGASGDLGTIGLA